MGAAAALALLVVAGPASAAAQKHHEATRAKTHMQAAAAKTVVISTRNIKGLGQVLVGKKDLTLYMFVPDKRKRVTCVSTCAVVWPPVKVTPHEKVVAHGKAKAKLLGSDRDPAGGRVVTYHGWPLYYYVSDRRPGQATGQALNLNGGLWYVLSPSGKVIEKKLA